jgi:hypothetical protein
LSVTLFEKTPIIQALTDSDCIYQDVAPGNQLTLFD